MEQLDYLEVDDIEVFEVLNNPLRFRILRELIQPASVKEVAESLDVPPTRLYYHVNLLEEAGIISVVETRKVGAMVQKVYQSRARGFRPSSQFALSDHEPQELARITAGVVLDGARVDVEAALTKHFSRLKAGEKESVHGAFGRTVAFFTEEEAEEFAEKLNRFIQDEFDPSDGSEGREFGLTFAFFPLAGTQDGEER